MAFVDERIIHIKGGDGGNGAVRFRHEKYKEFGGPAGGDGAHGGGVYLVAVRDIMYLGRYQEGERFDAPRGEDGQNHSRHGKRGEDLEIRVPVGTEVFVEETEERFELMYEGERVRVVQGGRGGRGNEFFKSSTDQTPRHAEPGGPGEAATLHLTLKLVADAGLVGLPNAGKSSLLNTLTNAQAKIGAYAFTTLEPNLGALSPYILADIPGLIEGAAHGKGLGIQFLKHITRTRALIHCVSCEESSVSDAYKTVRDELDQYDPALTQKPEYVVLTKVDMVDPDTLARKRDELAACAQGPVDVISILDDALMLDFTKRLRDFLAKQTPSATIETETN